jgi:ADP-heptose:LPS heptosyltransferase
VTTAEKTFDKNGKKKILVVRNDNLGDVICTTPAIEALRLSFPDAFIAALVADYTREALDGNPFLDRVYSYGKAKHSRSGSVAAWARQWGVMKDVRAEKFDLAIGIRSRFTKSHAWLVYLSGAPLRLGHRPERAGLISSKYYNIFCDDETGEKHEVERSLNVVRKIGVDIAEKRLMLVVPGDLLNVADEFVASHDLKGKNKLVCVHVTSRPEHGRVWPVDSYVRLIDGLNETTGVKVALNWLPSEEKTGGEILSKVKQKPPVFSASGIKSFAAFLKCADLLFTIEGGAMHIGAAAGVRTLAVFGKTSPAVWAPWGEGHATLQNGPSVALVGPDEALIAARKMLGKGTGQ